MALMDEFALLKISLRNAEECLKQIDDAYASKRPVTKGQVIRWALWQKEPIMKLLQHLQEVEKGLTDTLIVFSMCHIYTSVLTSHH